MSHPTFFNQWVMIGDLVTVADARGSEKRAKVTGLRVSEEGTAWVAVRYDRKPPGRSRDDWVLLSQDSKYLEWISGHEPQ